MTSIFSEGAPIGSVIVKATFTFDEAIVEIMRRAAARLRKPSSGVRAGGETVLKAPAEKKASD